MTLFLYSLIVRPLEIVIAFLFNSTYMMTHNILFSIFVLSFMVTVLCMPLYMQADSLQKEEDEMQKKMSKRIRSIKENYKGDEKYLLLQTYYRQNNYHPIMGLRMSLGLLLQIPIFCAAYTFFSHLPILNGMPLGNIVDLSLPDSLLTVGSIKINILPILMTIVNIISCEIYLKGKGIKARIQPYFLAAIFLVLLYNSPSALVIYWTFNNVFFGIKNEFIKTQNPVKNAFLLTLLLFTLMYINYLGGLYYLKTVKIFGLQIGYIMGLILVIVYFINYKKIILKVENWTNTIIDKAKKRPLVSTLVALFAILTSIKYIEQFTILLFILSAYVLYLSLIHKHVKTLWLRTKQNFKIQSYKSYFLLFILSCLGLYVLQSLFIPTNIISSDPNAFSLYDGKIEYIWRVLSYQTTCLFGLYLFWLPVIYYFVRKKSRPLVSIGLFSVLIYAIINYVIMGKNLGTINTEFVFSNVDAIKLISKNAFWQIANIIVLPLIFVLSVFIHNKFKVKALIYFTIIVIFSQSALVIFNAKRITETINNRNLDKNSQVNQIPKIELTRTGKNVIIIFMDRFMSSFMPIILDEKPWLREAFSGFTYYPNTVSFYGHTVLGYPSMLGGYEYTPKKLDRDSRPFADKFNEANLMLLKLFQQNNYSSTITDPPGSYGNIVKFVDDVDKFYKKNNIRYVILAGKLKPMLENFNNKNSDYINGIKIGCLKYSLMSISPLFLKKPIYDIHINRRHRISAEDSSFADFYSTLYYMDKITDLDSQQNTFTIINNDATHSSRYLQYPDYTLTDEITNTGINPFNSDYTHMAYHSTIGSFIQIAEYMEFLKKEKVYDNSRIIIVSDHGCIDCRNNVIFPNDEKNSILTSFNPLLMAKDFNQKGNLKTDKTFMTNADTPYLATENLIKNAKNPFTGKKFSTYEKTNGIDVYTNHSNYMGYLFTDNRAILDKNPTFMHVSKDVWDINNWVEVK